MDQTFNSDLACEQVLPRGILGRPPGDLNIGYHDHSFQNSQKVATREYFATVTPDFTFQLKTTLTSHQTPLNCKLEKACIPVPSILSPKALSILEYKDTYNVLKLMLNKSQRQYMATRTCKCFVCKDTTVRIFTGRHVCFFVTRLEGLYCHHGLYNFRETKFNDFSRKNYSFQGLRFIQ